MPTVCFQPGDRLAEVPAGTLIHQAALRAGILELELPCGGEGSCGLCKVKLEGNDTPILACQTKVNSDIVVWLPERQQGERVLGDSHALVDPKLLPQTGHLAPLYRHLQLTVPPASVEEHYSDWSRLVREMNRGNGSLPASCDLSVLRQLAGAIRAADGKVTVTVEESAGRPYVREVQPDHRTSRVLGLAVDIGTTTVATQLVDLNDGSLLATQTSYNLQIRRGADVINRIDYARFPERLEELRGLVLETINTLIEQMARANSLDPHDIRAAFLAGNTTMTHLFLGLPPRYIRESPYVPTVNSVPEFRAREVGLNIDPEGLIVCAPGVGSYVGGDITSGLLCTELPYNEHDVFLFMDIGTNGEIVIGNADWMVACACSAGPAFEGAGIKCGMRAAEGAIEGVTVGEDGHSLEYSVLGGVKPAGICGSGLISLLGELFRHEIVDRSGRFFQSPGSGRITQRENRRAFVLASREQTATGEELVITEADLENLIRTKAAIYAAGSLVLENVGLTWNAIARVYIAGGFGRYIRIADAVEIGMLPDLPLDRFCYIGNSSLTGAYMALLSREHRRRLAEIATRITYVDLSSNPRYMDSYIQALFLPHTDLGQFPTVAQTFESRRRKVS
ncbi:MAG TPA: ASKHA domain-containing protein [Candidatus Angelobacter sp.]|nr:ASKHA domain-containing protein [Candidatus Angelobacter sp.]